MARVHARFRTPHAAIGTIVAAVAAGALVLATGELLDDVVRHVVRAMVVAAYALVTAASVRFMLRIREQTVPVLGAAAGVGLLGYLVVAVVLDGRIGTAAVIVGLLAAGPLWQLYLRRRPARLDAVGAFDCAESADVLPGAGAFAADAAGNVVLVRRGRTS
jgi:amino acid transporter